MDKNLNVRLRVLCQSLRLDTLQGVDESLALPIKEAIKSLPSSEEIMSMSENQLETLRVLAQDLQFKLDNSRNSRTHDFAIRNLADKNLPPPRPPLLSTSNWYQLYKQSSVSRRCLIYLANNGKWYLELGDYEHAWEPHECTTYGPFESEELARGETDHHSNAGSLNIDRNGTMPAPLESPNGSPLQPPTRSGRGVMRW